MSLIRLTPSSFFARGLCSIALLLLVLLGCNGVACAAPKDTRAPDPQAVHQQLSKRGLGKAVKVTRLNGSTVKGHIAALTETAVDVQPGSGPTITIPLADVRKVRNGGMPKAAKIGIGVGAGILAIGLVGAVVVSYSL